jgi:predicted nucleotidyltransferase
MKDEIKPIPNAPRIPIDNDKIKAFCEKWKITEFSLFGSVLTDDFRLDSDVDVLVTFEEGAPWGLFDIVHMEDELKLIFGRDVDFVERIAVEQSPNYIRRKSILSSTAVVYAA